MPVTLAPDVSLVDAEDGTVLLDERTGRYWQLNGTGSMVLRELLAGGTVHDVAATVAAEFPAAAERCERDVRELLAELRRAKLVGA